MATRNARIIEVSSSFRATRSLSGIDEMFRMFWRSGRCLTVCSAVKTTRHLLRTGPGSLFTRSDWVDKVCLFFFFFLVIVRIVTAFILFYIVKRFIPVLPKPATPSTTTPSRSYFIFRLETLRELFLRVLNITLLNFRYLASGTPRYGNTVVYTTVSYCTRSSSCMQR